MRASCDIDCGDYYQNHVEHAVTAGALQEKEVDACACSAPA